MRTASKKSLAVAVLVGALMTAGTPGAAHAQPTTTNGSAALTSSELTAVAAETQIRIKNQKSGKYLTPSGYSTGTVGIVQEPSSSKAVQKWLIGADGDYSFFVNAGFTPYKCIGVSGASTTPGTQAIQAACGPDSNQEWLKKWRSDTVFELHNRKDTTKCLGINGGSKNDGAEAMIFTCDTSTNQAWSAVPA